MVTHNRVSLTQTFHSGVGIIQIIRHFGIWKACQEASSIYCERLTSYEPYSSFDYVSSEDAAHH